MTGAVVALAAALIVSLCVVLVWRRERCARMAMAQWDTGLRRIGWSAGLLVVSAFCVGAALVCPEPANGSSGAHVESGPIVFVLDVSRSMDVGDVTPSRRGAAVALVRRLAAEIHDRPLGLVAFAGEAATLCPPTADRQALGTALADAVQHGGDLSGGSDPSLGIDRALDTLRRHPAPGAIVLLSDGEPTAGDLNLPIRRARALGVPVHAVGIGTSAGASMPVARPIAGEPVRPEGLRTTRLDETVLRQVASSTTGRYFAGTDDVAPGLEDALEDGPAPAVSSTVIQSPAQVLLLVAFVCLSAEWGVSRARRT